MAGNPGAVYSLLDRLWAPALARAKTEAADMQALVDAEGGGFTLAAWDWWHYAEKVKKARFDLDEGLLPELCAVNLAIAESLAAAFG